MIIFENEKYLENIRKNGIGATDKNAKFKINYLISDLVKNTSYRKSKIISIVKDLTSEYFCGLPAYLVEQELGDFYDAAKNCEQEYNYQDKIITLYESEMKTIADLKDDKLMRLAFASLVCHKYLISGKERYYSTVQECESDIYQFAQLDNVSGTSKDKLWKQLTDLGLVKYFAKTNPAWRFHPDWSIMIVFTVPFNADLKEDKADEKIYKRITNYDDILLYLRYWVNDTDLIECTDCGAPILRTGNAKCLCSNCAVSRKKSSDKARYKRKLEIA